MRLEQIQNVLLSHHKLELLNQKHNSLIVIEIYPNFLNAFFDNSQKTVMKI